MPGTKGSYAAHEVDGFAGATLVTFEPDSGTSIPIGAFVGMPDGMERVKASHARYARTLAAWDAATRLVETHADVLGRPADHFPSRAGTDAGLALRRSQLAHVTDALRSRDAYHATRSLEKAFRIEADDELYTAVAEALVRIGIEEGTSECRERAARQLRDTSPGPSTLLNRMVAARDGLTRTADGIQDLPSTDTTVSKVLGTLTTVPGASGSLLPAPFTTELTVIVRYDLDSLEFEGDAIEFAGVDFLLLHDPATWQPSDGLLYGDTSVEAAVAKLLAERGLDDIRVAWSEHGRQQWHSGDMDVGFDIVERLWPEAVAKERAAKAQDTALAP